MTRYKRYKLWREASKIWRNATGGTMRYRWNIGGAHAEFSASDPNNLKDLLEHVETFAKMLRAVHENKIMKIDDNEDS